jgi:Na+-driven multidrug efflux pump
MLFGQVITATTASIGNYIVSDNKNKIFQVFKKIRFINFYISMFTSICLLLIIQPFINIWVGKNFLLEYSIVIVLVFNFFQKMQRNTYNAFKDSAGIWKEDKFIPLIESALNILFSIIGIKIFGLIGVFIGTIISGLVLWCYSYPKYVYKKLLKRSYKNYAIETIGYILTFILIALTTYGFSLIFSFDNLIIQIIVELIICISIPNLLFYVIFRKTDNFGYIKYLIKNAKK